MKKIFFLILTSCLLAVGAQAQTKIVIGGGGTTGGVGVADGDKGEITVSGAGTFWSLKNFVVTIPKIAASGTPTSSTVLYGDGVWRAPSGGTGGTIGTTDQDIEITDFSKGVVFKTPNGSRYRLTMTNEGELITTKIL